MSVCLIICFIYLFGKINSSCIYVLITYSAVNTLKKQPINQTKPTPHLCFLFCLFLFSSPQWHALSREEQAKYYELARKERQLHMQLYPGWSARDNYVGSYVGGNFFSSRACRNVYVTC